MTYGKSSHPEPSLMELKLRHLARQVFVANDQRCMLLLTVEMHVGSIEVPQAS